MRILITWLTALAGPIGTSAQNGWSFIDSGASQRTVMDMAFLNDGSSIGIYHSFPDSTQIARMGAYLFDMQGVKLRDTLYHFGSLSMLPEAIPTQPDDHFRVLGFGRDTAHLNGGTAFQYTAWISPDLVIDTLKMIHTGFDYCVGQFIGVIGTDRQIQPLRCRINGQSSSPNHLLLLETDLNGDSIASMTYSFAPGSINYQFDVVGLDSAGFILSVWGTPFPAGAVVYGKAIYFDDQLQFLQAKPMNHAVSPPDMVTMPYSNVDLLKLPDGTILVGGRYQTSFSGQMRSVIQKVDQRMDLLQQFAPVSAFMADHVSLHQCMDTTPDGHILFGHMERFDALSPMVMNHQPDKIRIYKLDLDLQVICEYEVDGFADSTYYTLGRVKATPDGGAVALGSALDLATPGATPKAWVRRFAPGECGFTGMPPQYEEGQLVLYPNPGNEGFHLVLPAGMRHPLLLVFDTAGRMVHQAPYIAGVRVDASDWPKGLYAVVLREERFGSWWARWVKE